jgi:hypothetical protein
MSSEAMDLIHPEIISHQLAVDTRERQKKKITHEIIPYFIY